MTLNDIKIYLQGRPFPVVIPNDEELQKFLNFALLVIKIFYGVDLTNETTSEAITIIGEEIAYLLENNPFEDIAKQYDYLKSFAIGNGALRVEIIDKSIGFLGDLVKNLMKAAGYDLLQGNITYTYSIF